VILRCLLTTVTRNRKGQPIRASKLVSGDPITVGRGTESTIYLPDPRVHLRHGIIRISDLGKLYLEAWEAPIDVNGDLVNRTKLRRGVRILIGPYQVIPEPAADEDHDFGLAIELVQPFPADLTDLRERSRTSLSETWLPKRGLAWALFLLVGILSLGLPLAYAISPGFRSDETPGPFSPLRRVVWNALWNPGPLSSSHQSLAKKCDACHQVAFERVQDSACVRCHSGVGDHVIDASAEAGTATLGQCAACHLDHQGEVSGMQVNSKPCVECHRGTKSNLPGATRTAVTDFAQNHPDFSYSGAGPDRATAFANPPGTGVESRAPSGLKFSHQLHLAGGLRSPTGRQTLKCAQCHRPDLESRGFERVRMVDHCEECHGLAFEPATTSRRVPHGKPEDVLTMLREFYSRVALSERPIDVTLVNERLRKPVEDPTRVESRRASAWAEQKARSVAKEIIETRVCAQCHSVSRSSGPAPWVVQPVHMKAEHLKSATFDHKAHQQADCTTCHRMGSSNLNADVAFPAIEVCRSCHAGAKEVAGKVRSPCEKCHSFHQHPSPRGGAASSTPSPALPSPLLSR
jgi:predicted CXXCH cytochrome family protein